MFDSGPDRPDPLKSAGNGRNSRPRNPRATQIPSNNAPRRLTWELNDNKIRDNKIVHILKLVRS